MAALNLKPTAEDIIFHIFGYIFFTAVLLLCAYPFYYLLISTISDNQMVELGMITVIPKGVHFDNYVKVMQTQNLLNSTFISVLRVLTGTTANILVTSYVAYFFTKEEMWGRKFFYRMVVVTMYFSAGMIPVYLNNRMLHLTNTFFIYIIPGLLSVYNMVLVKTSIEAMPKELEESAHIDGAGYLMRLFMIVLPLQQPILATIALFSAIGHWNDFFTTMLYITNTRLYTLQFLLYELLKQVTAASQQITDYSVVDPAAILTPTGIRLTLTAIVVIPVMLVYPFVQKFYVKGIMLGAVKG
jgi:multiple sugar transport system permease protein/putative aldouronate transport system permease protein